MNRIDILLKQWRLGIIRDPDLHLALKIINDYKHGKVENERKSKDIQGTGTVSGEVICSTDSGSKTKGLRKRNGSRPTGRSSEDSGTV